MAATDSTLVENAVLSHRKSRVYEGGGPLLPGLNFLPFNCSSYIVGHNFAGFREGRAVPRPA
jgi:hypothetical protein